MTTDLKVQNIQCGGCANTIMVQLSAMTNISDVEVDQSSAVLTFSHTDHSDIEAVVNKLDTIGFPVDHDS